MKKIWFLAVILILPLIFLGCQEVENPETQENMEKKTAIVEEIDLSAVSAPEEVCVYSAALWEKEPEKVAGIFLGSDFKEEESVPRGRIFSAVRGREN